MEDLYDSLLLMYVLCGSALIAGFAVGVRAPGRILRAGQLSLTAVLLVYLLLLWDRPVLSRLLPVSGLIVLSNWLPVFGSCFAGMYLATTSIPLLRRIVLSCFIMALGSYSLIRPLLGEPPRCYAQAGGTVLQFQSDDATCSAASAASVLRMHGIATSESEMARLCLTRAGTHWMGVYRGLKLKLRDTPWDVVAEDFDPQTHLALSGDLTGVLSLTFVSRGGPTITADGYSGVIGHSVVAIETTTDHGLRVFDPSPDFALEVWDREFLSDIRTGVLLRMIPRDPANPARPPRTQLVDLNSTADEFALR